MWVSRDKLCQDSCKFVLFRENVDQSLYQTGGLISQLVTATKIEYLFFLTLIKTKFF